MSKQPDKILLEHILESCGIISGRIKGLSRAEFIKNDILVDATVRQIENIGEAVRMLSPELKADYPKIPWVLIQAMRNRLVHAYWATDAGAVFETASKDIPKLASDIALLVKK